MHLVFSPSSEKKLKRSSSCVFGVNVEESSIIAFLAKQLQLRLFSFRKGIRNYIAKKNLLFLFGWMDTVYFANEIRSFVLNEKTLAITKSELLYVFLWVESDRYMFRWTFLPLAERLRNPVYVCVCACVIDIILWSIMLP